MRGAVILFAAVLVPTPFSAPGTFVSTASAQTAEQSAKSRARRSDFDADVTITCAQAPSDAMEDCPAQIAFVDTEAALVATFQSGFKRTLYFEDGAFLRGNATMSGVGTDIEWTLVDGLHSIRVDDQRFEVPADILIPKK